MKTICTDPTPKSKKSLFLSKSLEFFLVVVLLSLSGKPLVAQVLLPYQSTWKYAPEGTSYGTTSWAATSFNDAAWLSGQGAFGFGAHAYNTPLQRGPGNAPPNYPVFYFRKAVTIPSAGAYTSYRLRAFLDDGAVIYVNGVEVARKNVNPSNPNFPYTGAAGDSLVIDTLLSASLFQNGTNLIAASVHQTGSTSSDILFDLQLEGVSSGPMVLPYQSTWKYAPEGTSYGTTSWAATSFNDAAWLSGQGAFGFGAHAYNTPLQRGPGNAPPNYPVFYFRKAVTIPSAGAYTSYRLRAFLDDGAVIYVNGVEVARKNVNPSNPNFPYTGAAGDSLVIDTLLSASLFQNGTNLIAAAVHQTGSTSSDILFDLQLEGQTSQVSVTRYPYLQLPGHDRMTVMWYTNLPTASTVRYSTNPNLSSGYLEEAVALTDTHHVVTLSNLLPDTPYYYSVGYGTGGSFQLIHTSTATRFRTQPSPSDTTQTMRFWLLGDSGAGNPTNPRPKKVRDAYLNYLSARSNPNVNAIIFLGDNSNTFPYEGLQPALDTTLFRFYNRPNDKQLLSYMPSWTVMGNHDYDPDYVTTGLSGQTTFIKKAYHLQTAASYSTFAFPANGEFGGVPTLNKKGYYSFNQGDIHFVVLNPYLIEGPTATTNPSNGDMWMDGNNIRSTKSIALDYTYNTPIDSLPQVKWLVNDLSTNTKKWTIVTFHLPPFSTMGHFPDLPEDFDMKRVQEKLLPILEKPQYRVDALLVSHSHAYLRAGMIRKNGAQPRTTDFTQFNNLGRYPTTPPYLKTNNETAYTYLLSGSAGRGWYLSPSQSDAGYADSDASHIKHPNTSVPQLDNLTGDNSTAFYHVTGGSVELVFRENRLDVKFIKESDVTPFYVIADSFAVMKDVNKLMTLNSPSGTSTFNLRASWVGNYQWFASTAPTTLIASTRTLSVTPPVTTTYFAKDGYGHLMDTFQINVGNLVQSVQSGDWHNTATWNCACIPTSSHTVQINATHTVTVSTGDALLKDLVKNGGIVHLTNGRKLCFNCTP